MDIFKGLLICRLRTTAVAFVRLNSVSKLKKRFKKKKIQGAKATIKAFVTFPLDLPVLFDTVDIVRVKRSFLRMESDPCLDISFLTKNPTSTALNCQNKVKMKFLIYSFISYLLLEFCKETS